ADLRGAGVAGRQVDASSYTLGDNGIVVPGMAADNAAEGDVTVEVARVQSHRHCGWQFKSTRNRDRLVRSPSSLKRGYRAMAKGVGYIGVGTGLHDQEVVAVGRAGFDGETGTVGIHVRDLCWSELVWPQRSSNPLVSARARCNRRQAQRSSSRIV